MHPVTPSSRRRSRRIPAATYALLLGLLAVEAVQGQAVLNEILYDPAGADGGGEFVELHNPGDAPVALAGWTLEFANGAVGDLWEVRWRAGPDDAIGAGRRFLIVDRGWDGPTPGDAEVALGLQNGPDAVRLRCDGEVMDLLGYGALEQPALSEGRPHPGATGGRSLARRPDGADTDHNDLDWHLTEEPTPGLANVERWSFRLESFVLTPPAWSVTGRSFTLDLTWLNDGLDPYPGVAALLCDAEGTVLAECDLPVCAPGDEVSAGFAWEPVGEGRVALTAAAPRPDEGDTLRFAVGSAWAGPPPLRFSEVMPAPASGRPEWVEFETPRAAADLDLDGWSFADDGGEPRALPSRLLARGDRIVMTADRESFAAWVTDLLDAGAPWPCAEADVDRFACEGGDGWPVLNNTAGEDRAWADRLLLRAPDGTVVDWVAWGGAYPPPATGRSLERIDGAAAVDPSRRWAPSTARIGATPGCPSSLNGPGGGMRLTATPQVFGEGGTSLGFELGEGERSWDLVVLDLDTRPVRSLGGDSLGSGPRTIAWSGSTDGGEFVAAGPWLVLLRTRDSGGGIVRRDRIVVVRDREQW